MVLWRSGSKMAFWLQKIAAQTPICSPNANSTQLRYLQPKRQFAADCQFAAQTPICSQNANSLQICSQNANSLQICSQNANSLPVCSPNASLLPIAGLQPERQFAARTPIRCLFAAQTPISRFRAFLQHKRISAAQTHVSQHRLCSCSCAAIIGAVKPCLRHIACFPDKRPCGFCGAATPLRPCKPALRSIRARASHATPTAGPAVFAGPQLICVPANRPFGLFGHGHYMVPWQQALLFL